MANYSLFTITDDKLGMSILAKDPEFGRMLGALCAEAKYLLPESGTPAPVPLKINGENIGLFFGRFYDGDIAPVEVGQNQLAFVVKHDQLDEAENLSGQDISKLARRFKRVAVDTRLSLTYGSIAPVYWNNSPTPKIIEFHKTLCREQDDAHTRWDYDNRSTYHTLVRKP